MRVSLRPLACMQRLTEALLAGGFCPSRTVQPFVASDTTGILSVRRKAGLPQAVNLSEPSRPRVRLASATDVEHGSHGGSWHRAKPDRTAASHAARPLRAVPDGDIRAPVLNGRRRSRRGPARTLRSEVSLQRPRESASARLRGGFAHMHSAPGAAVGLPGTPPHAQPEGGHPHRRLRRCSKPDSRAAEAGPKSVPRSQHQAFPLLGGQHGTTAGRVRGSSRAS